MIAENETNKSSFDYVWRCSKATVADRQSIPINPGDYLFICIMDDGSAKFRYRECDWRDSEPCASARKNAEEWAGATARFDGKMISGHLRTKERKFEIAISRNGYGYTLRARHFVNPDEGEWEGSDDWGGQQQ